MGRENPPKPQEDFSLKETNPHLGGGRVSNNDKFLTAFDLVEEMQFLYVRVVKARDLPVKDVNNSCDPYVEVKVGNYKGTTRHFEKELNPEWNEVFAFAKERIQASVIEIMVKDKEVMANGYMGQVVYEVSEVPKRVPPDSPLAPQWYRLEDQRGIKTRGELMLAVWMGTQADEAFSNAWHADTAAASVTGEGVKNTRSKVYLSPRLWYVRVNIIEAQDLVLRDKNRKPEVYVRAEIGNFVLRSRVSQNKNVNPTWNEDLMLVAAEPFNEPLILRVEDSLGPNRDDCFGRCLIPLQKVEKRFNAAGVGRRWYNLERHLSEGGEQKKDIKFSSRLHLAICLDGGYHVLDESTHYASDLLASSKLLRTPSIGVLELGILNANGLVPMKSRDGRGTTDAYCVAKYGSKWIRTRTIVDNLAPKWNEQYTWEVFDPCTVISIGIFDNCQLQGGGKDLRIGKVRIRLSTLETDRIYTLSFPLIVLQPSGVKKTGEIQLAVRFTCSSMLNMLHTYVQPFLPKMHYIQPLSVYQVESLRHQAMQVVTLRLSLAEPPLRREVVEYMLDIGSDMWSMRKFKANYERVMKILNCFLVTWKWFEENCSWKNPVSTFMILTVFIILLILPELILPCICLMVFLSGLWHWRTRPRHPPHMDTRLSYADTVPADELDEEFDTFPSSRQANVLKVRYERLRSFAGRMQTVLGDMATQGERVQSLLSWRDPRATFLFLVFCMVSGIIFYTIPFRLLVFFIGLWMLRPSRFRTKIPLWHRRFLRRLPTKQDSML